MSAFLSSVKADLLDRRLLAGVLALGAALAAALGYAALAGNGTGGSSVGPVTPGGGASSATSAQTPGIAVSQAPANPAEVMAETTSGSSDQRKGAARDPFTPFAGTSSTSATTSATASKTSGSSTSSGSSGSSTQTGSSSPGAGATTPTAAPKPSQPAKPKTPAQVYHVAALFGVVPAGTPPQSVQLTPYENIAPLTPLPSSKEPLVIFKGTTSGGKSATFTLAGEVILHGSATCVPSASQCLEIDLAPGQDEELEYLPPGGGATTYKLQVVTITSTRASAARAHISRRHKA
jgi:hypothetical protein